MTRAETLWFYMFFESRGKGRYFSFGTLSLTRQIQFIDSISLN